MKWLQLAATLLDATISHKPWQGYDHKKKTVRTTWEDESAAASKGVRCVETFIYDGDSAHFLTIEVQSLREKFKPWVCTAGQSSYREINYLKNVKIGFGEDMWHFLTCTIHHL